MEGFHKTVTVRRRVYHTYSVRVKSVCINGNIFYSSATEIFKALLYFAVFW
jgi:hypothetical protein